MSKTVIIWDNASTAELEAEGTIEVNCKVIFIPTVNEASADEELGEINTEYWTASATVTEKNGDTTEGFFLPKKIVEG